MRGKKEPRAAKLGLFVSMEETAEYKSSALFYECLFTMLGWNFLKSTVAFASSLSLKLQC